MSLSHYVFKPSLSYVCLFVCSSGQILLSWRLMNGSNNFDTTDREYLVTPTDDLITFWGQRSSHGRPSRSSLVNTISHELLERS